MELGIPERTPPNNLKEFFDFDIRNIGLLHLEARREE